MFNVDRVAQDEETRTAVAQHGIIVTEGCFDAVWLSEHGFKNVVATMGCDVSDEQCKMLVDRDLNPTRRVTIFFDADESGRCGRKDLCGKLVYDAFVRYVDFRRVNAAHRTDPDQFTKEELTRLLS